MAISKKVAERIRSQLKRYQAILADAKARDISESDTVTTPFGTSPRIARRQDHARQTSRVLRFHSAHADT